MNTKSIKLATMGLSVALGLGVATVANADTVTVKSGDTLSELASTYNTTIDALANDNQISDINFIVVGDVLQVNAKAVNQQAQSDNASASASVASSATPSTTATLTTETQTTVPTTSNSGSTYDQFIANGGTDAMWNTIVMPESGGNVDATNGQYHGLGQTNQSWGYGSVATQTQGMIDYAVSRYGSIDGALAFRSANNWW